MTAIKAKGATFAGRPSLSSNGFLDNVGSLVGDGVLWADVSPVGNGFLTVTGCHLHGTRRVRLQGCPHNKHDAR